LHVDADVVQDGGGEGQAGVIFEYGFVEQVVADL
jgi:hypothetical protein